MQLRASTYAGTTRAKNIGFKKCYRDPFGWSNLAPNRYPQTREDIQFPDCQYWQIVHNAHLAM